MFALRTPTLADVDALARIHVQSWQETYPGLLPPEEIAARDLKVRRQQWASGIAAGHSRIAYAPDLGFAQSGPQREAALQPELPQELYAIYLLQSAQGSGLGQTLFHAVRPTTAFSALVLAGNHRAIRFYKRTGGEIRETRTDMIGTTTTQEHLMVWPAIGD